MKLKRKEQAKIMIQRAGMHNWQIAQRIGIREESLSRWFRADDITDEQLAMISEACERQVRTND